MIRVFQPADMGPGGRSMAGRQFTGTRLYILWILERKPGAGKGAAAPSGGLCL